MKKKLREIAPWLLLCVGGSLSHNALAITCANYATEQQVNIDIGRVVIQRDVAIGSKLYDSGWIKLPDYKCDADWTYQGILGLFTVPAGLSDTYNTNIPGVGIAIWGGMGTMIPKENATSANVTNANFNIGFALYKTGPTGSGPISVGRIARIGYKNIRWMVSLNLTGGTVSPTTCSVANTAINVPMGDRVDRRVFTGVGSSGSETSFSIPLSCDKNTKVKIKIDGTAVSSGTTGVLALTPSSSETVASGVGVQLSYNSKPVALGTLMSIGTATADGLYSIPLTARYYQTGSSVTAGKADSTATFTMTYN